MKSYFQSNRIDFSEELEPEHQFVILQQKIIHQSNQHTYIVMVSSYFSYLCYSGEHLKVLRYTKNIVDKPMTNAFKIKLKNRFAVD
jgi:hypothetical protein